MTEVKTVFLNQRLLILMHLIEHDGMTTLDAREHLGIMNPSSRISELRELGFPIETKLTRQADIAGKSHTVGMYVLNFKTGCLHIMRELLAIINISESSS